MRAWFALLCLLALTTSAHAECAWVLWSVVAEVDPKVPIATADITFLPSRWQPLKAYEKASACNEAREQSTQDAARMLLSGKRNKAGMVETNLYCCLPDTIDPRGAKGRQ